MVRIALIACDHGFGHTRRILRIAKYLISNNQDLRIDLFASLKIVNQIDSNLFTNSKLGFIDLQTNTSLTDEFFKSPFKWLEIIPDLSFYDKVVCDNLPEILSVRSDSIISGSFLWIDAVMGFKEEDIFFVTKLIKAYKPTMISLKYFSLNLTRYDFKLFETGFLVEDENSNLMNKSTKLGILVTGGKSRKIDNELTNMISQYKHELILRNIEVFVDRNIYNENLDFVKIAQYDDYMFGKIIAAIARPGIGIISDSVNYAFKIFSYYEHGNFEMTYNAESLEKLGLGVDSNNPFNELFDFIDNKKLQRDYFANLHKLNRKGLEEYHKIILR